jgi:hypothetical protein
MLNRNRRGPFPEKDRVLGAMWTLLHGSRTGERAIRILQHNVTFLPAQVIPEPAYFCAISADAADAPG